MISFCLQRKHFQSYTGKSIHIKCWFIRNVHTFRLNLYYVSVWIVGDLLIKLVLEKMVPVSLSHKALLSAVFFNMQT